MKDAASILVYDRIDDFPACLEVVQGSFFIIFHMSTKADTIRGQNGGQLALDLVCHRSLTLNLGRDAA